ncbi:MAG: hypothetical protein CK533_05845 [Acidobacterium sp.]|nr:MAG: hypothetical protein CK533_05845 [Acidobacterium sp.]
MLKLDSHVHTQHSGQTTIYPLSLVMRESYNTPEGVYQLAKARGMDLVTITDHDQVSGALSIAHYPDVIVGCEVTAVLPNDGVRVHLNVFGQQGIYTSLNHVASGINGPLTAAHLAAILPWVDGLEVINGTRLPSQNRTALCLAQATGKHLLGGGDSYTGRGIGLTWTEVPGAHNREEFMAGLRAGRVIAAGDHGGHRTMLSDMWRFAGNFIAEGVTDTATRPTDWRGYACAFGGVLGLPIMPLVMTSAFVHFLHEQRFNRDLLYDLLAKPGAAAGMAPGLAA